MRFLAALGLAIALLSLPAGALAQGGSPFAPLQPTPAPPPEPPTAPSNPDAAQADDEGLSTVELLGLAGIALLLFAAVAVVIVREGRRLKRRELSGKGRGGRSQRKPSGIRKGAEGRPKVGATDAARGDRKAPPPPPRKRRQKSKRR